MTTTSRFGSSQLQRVAAMVGVWLIGCASELTCPGGRERQGDLCVCPDETVASSDGCAGSPNSPHSGQVDAGPEVAGDSVDGQRELDASVSGAGDSGTEGGPGAAPAGEPDEAAPARIPGVVPSVGGGAPPPEPPRGEAGCGPTCPAGRCGQGGVCLTGAPQCGDGNVDPGEQCDDGNRLTFDHCVGCRSAFCGDGHIERDAEDCDRNDILPHAMVPGFAEEYGTWTRETCSVETQCQRTVYTLCETDLDCPGGGAANCALGYCAPTTCLPADPPNPYCKLPACPRIPNYRIRVHPNYITHCLLSCATGGACPVGMRCGEHDLCVGKDWTPEKRGFPIEPANLR